MTAPTAANPAKLSDGSWGARVKGAVSIGDELLVTTRAGKSWAATVADVVSERDGVSLVSTESRKAAPRRGSSRRSSGGICDNCDEPRRNLQSAVDTSGIGGRVCPRCVREGDLSFA